MSGQGHQLIDKICARQDIAARMQPPPVQVHVVAGIIGQTPLAFAR